MNKVLLIGNITRDVEFSETNNGIAVCRFTVAVSRNYYDSNGEKITDFFNVIAWRGQAENCGKYLKKGSKVAVDGTLQNRSYEDKDGNKRQVTEVIAERVEFLSSSQKQENEEKPKVKQESRQVTLTEITDEELPF